MPEAAPTQETSTPDGVPSLVIPDYTLLRRIGRGSYGDVWLARSVTGVFRVIKIVQRSRFEDERPFLRELEGISRFQAAVSGRPRQLALLHVGRNDDAGYFYYVMEPADDAVTGSAIDPDRYVPLTLREMLKRRDRLPASDCVQFTLELARGLSVLHEENLIHRDIKPSNVIFVQRVPKLADVGLVAAADATLTGVGTPGYLPPEGPGSVTADIFSLGKVLYQISTGMDLSQYPRIPSELADHPDAPLLREINSIVLKACSAYPQQRHPSAMALARDLELVQAGRSVAFYERVRKQSRAIVVATASLAIMAAMAAGLFVWRSKVLERANEQTRRALYRSDLAIAQLAKASGDFGRARAALARQSPASGDQDLRGMEWAILAHAVRGEGAPLEPIPKPVAITKIAVDPTGRWAAAAFIDDRVGVWDLHTGRLARVIDNARVLGGFLADGRIVIDEPDRIIRYESPMGGASQTWTTGHRLRALLADGRVLGVTPEGDYIYKIFEYPNSHPSFSLNLSSIYPGAEVSGIAATDDGKFLAIGFYTESGAIRERRLLSFDIKTSKALWTVKAPDSLGWLHASPDGIHFVANIGWTKPFVMQYRNPTVQTPLVGHSARVSDAAYSWDGQRIATTSADQTIRVWDSINASLLSTFQGLPRSPATAAWHPNGANIIAGDEGGNLRVFRFPKEEKRQAISGMFSDMHGDVAISSHSSFLAVTKSTNSIAIVSASSLEEMSSLPNLFQPILFSDSNRYLYAFSSDWSLFRTDIFSKDSVLVGNPLPESFSVVSWTLSDNMSNLAVTGDGGDLAIIDIRSGRAVHAHDPESQRAWAVAFTPGSEEVWTGSANGVIRRWNRLDASILGTVTHSPPEIQSMAISPDEKWLAASFYNDASIRIFDLRSQTWSRPMLVHRRFVQSLFFADEGRRLISGGVDGRIIVWNVPDFEQITGFDVSEREEASGDEGIAVLKASPNRDLLVALTEDGRLQVWHTK